MELDARQAFEAELKEEGRPVLVEFWAPWCAPCRMMAPALEKYAQDYAGQVTLRKINADENPELLRALNVMAVPTMLVYQDGQEVQRRVGAQSPQQLHSLFERMAKGETQPAASSAVGLAPIVRGLRLTVGIALLLLGYWLVSWPVLILGAVIAFWGWHDRCPIWQALAPRLKALVARRE